MLILTRKPGESLYIGDNVKVTIVEIKGHQIRVGIDAPPELRIYREEIYQQIIEENKKAAEAVSASAAGLESLSTAWSGRKQVDPSKKGLAAFSSEKVLPQTQVLRRRRRKEEDEEKPGSEGGEKE
jgi:carbon storage regulator